MHFREIGLNSASGSISIGNFINVNIGDKTFPIPSIIPELLNAPMAKNNPIRVGIIFIVVSNPSLVPSINISKTFFFSNTPYSIIISITSGTAIIEM